MLIIKSRFTFVFITILILLGCKSEKQIQQLKNHLLLTEDGFYFRKNEIYSSDEYLLLKFYKNGHLSELSTSQNNLGILKNSKDFTCLLDELSNPPTNYYLVKGDSIFFKKKAWDSYEYANLKFECKTYKDSIVAKLPAIAMAPAIGLYFGSFIADKMVFSDEFIEYEFSPVSMKIVKQSQLYEEFLKAIDSEFAS